MSCQIIEFPLLINASHCINLNFFIYVIYKPSNQKPTNVGSFPFVACWTETHLMPLEAKMLILPAYSQTQPTEQCVYVMFLSYEPYEVVFSR